MIAQLNRPFWGLGFSLGYVALGLGALDPSRPRPPLWPKAKPGLCLCLALAPIATHFSVVALGGPPKHVYSVAISFGHLLCLRPLPTGRAFAARCCAVLRGAVRGCAGLRGAFVPAAPGPIKIYYNKARGRFPTTISKLVCPHADRDKA